MKTRNKVLLAAVATAVLGGASFAGFSIADQHQRDHGWRDGGHHERWLDGARRGGHHRRGGRGERLLENFDGNGDGTVTRDEIDQARSERFDTFDSDGDGRLGLQEYQALWLETQREHMVDRFQALDDDGDALVTAEEFQAPYARLARRLDRNDDGEITGDELRRR